MKYKCTNESCCNCHTKGHEWEGKQSSKYYVKCPMCKKDMTVDEAIGKVKLGSTHTETFS